VKALLQRVSEARVVVEGETIGAIEQGLLVLLAVEPEDTREAADKLLRRLLDYRVFSDSGGKMNLSLKDVGGGLLLVSQFTLAADTRSGLRSGCLRAFWRGYAGQPDQRRSGDLPVTGLNPRQRGFTLENAVL
jgi:D-tyrosyl-tRNA(Tyr) deacylase